MVLRSIPENKGKNYLSCSTQSRVQATTPGRAIISFGSPCGEKKISNTSYLARQLEVSFQQLQLQENVADAIALYKRKKVENVPKKLQIKLNISYLILQKLHIRRRIR